MVLKTLAVLTNAVRIKYIFASFTHSNTHFMPTINWETIFWENYMNSYGFGVFWKSFKSQFIKFSYPQIILMHVS